MRIPELRTHFERLFGKERLADPSEWGFTVELASPISHIGFATNLEPETVEAAVAQDVDLLVTHHDAWDFLHGMKDRCVTALQEHGISHVFVHLPLDDADFGTNTSLIERLGAKVVERTHMEGIYSIGAVGEYEAPLPFHVLVRQFENVLEERALAWQNHDRPVRRIGVVTGAGLTTDHVQEAVAKGCDVYITGERILYTVQYARFAEINLLVGSHTFTEVFGVQSLAQRIQEAFPHVRITRIEEKHLETEAHESLLRNAP